jgi:hypothetical protein
MTRRVCLVWQEAMAATAAGTSTFGYGEAAAPPPWQADTGEHTSPGGSHA